MLNEISILAEYQSIPHIYVGSMHVVSTMLQKYLKNFYITLTKFSADSFLKSNSFSSFFFYKKAYADVVPLDAVFYRLQHLIGLWVDSIIRPAEICTFQPPFSIKWSALYIFVSVWETNNRCLFDANSTKIQHPIREYTWPKNQNWSNMEAL